MTAFVSKYLQDAHANWWRGTPYPTPPAQVFLALITTAPTDRSGTSMVEASGGSYARQAVQTILAAPAAPAPTNAATGGTVPAGVYQVQVTYVNANGETVGSGVGSTTTSGSTSTLTVPSPAASAGATGWYAYVTQAGGSTYYRQQASGSPTAIGTNLTLTANPTTTGANPPGTNTTSGFGATSTNGSGTTAIEQNTSDAAVSFTNMPACTVLGGAWYDAASGGNFLGYSDLAGGSQVVAAGATFNFPIGNITNQSL